MEAESFSEPKTSGAAIASLVCGILGCIPFVPGLVAFILGIVGIKKTGSPAVKGRGMAIAGTILGFLSVAGWTGFAVLTIFTWSIIGEPARGAGEKWTKAVSEGKIDEALALSVPGFDRKPIEELGEKMKPWGAFQSLGKASVSITAPNGKAVFNIGGQATFASATKTYSFSMQQVDGATYLVEKFDFQ
jgi:hypothetical protein